MPIPYLGSKRRSAGLIYQTIKNLNPNADTLVDLFCGGFAVGEYFLKNGWRVIANDKNKYVIALLKKTIFEGLDEKKITKFIERNQFFNVKNHPEKYKKWFVGYVMCIWSYGNNLKGYMYNKNIEEYKKAGHELVINKNPSLIKKLIPEIPQKYIDRLLQLDSWHKRRLALIRLLTRFKKRILNLQYSERLASLQHLERLERLQQLEKFKHSNYLKFYSEDYRNVKIPKGAIVYCDPPYEGVAEYSIEKFNHKEFWEWVREKSKTNGVYVSEYKAPEDFKKVLEFKQNSSYGGGANKSQPNECLFTCNL